MIRSRNLPRFTSATGGALGGMTYSKGGGARAFTSLQRTNVSSGGNGLPGYLAVLDDPFAAPEGASLPLDGVVMPTEKFKVHTKFVCPTTTAAPAGGMIAVWAPCFANDLQGGWCNTAATVLNTATTINAIGVTGKTAFNYSDGPYADSRFTTVDGNQVLGRCVGGGLRVTYVGSAQDRAGVFYAFETPTHTDLTTTLLSSVLADENARVGPNTGSISVYWTGPKLQRDTEFFPKGGIQTYGGSGTAAFVDGCLVIYGAGFVAGSSFLVEMVQHFECSGPGIQSPSITYPGPNDLNIAIRAANRYPGTKPMMGNKSSGVLASVMRGGTRRRRSGRKKTARKSRR